MVETVGLIILNAIGFGALASEVIIGTVTIGALVGTGALVAGSIGLQMLLERPAEGPASAARTQAGGATASLPGPESGHQALKQPIPPRIVAYGRNRLAGAYVLYEEKDGISWDIIAFHHGRIGGFIGYYLHDDVVIRDPISGYVQGMSDGRYAGDIVYIAQRDGTVPGTVYGEVTLDLPEIWNSSYLGSGIASLLLKCSPVPIEDFTEKYPRGKPEPSVVFDGAPIFDPRTPGQDRLNPLTWQTRFNPVLQLLDVLTNTDRGMGLDWNTLVAPVLNTLMVEAFHCDTFVATAGGGIENRYKSDGFYSLDSDPVDAINTILDTCDGWLSENGDGTLALKVGVYRAPTVTLTSSDIKGFSIQKGLADEEIVNELVIDYTEPQLDYKTVPGTPWRDEASIAELGRVRSQRFALPWVQSHPQARRLAKRRMQQLSAPLRGTITTTLYGLTALGERWIKVEAPEIADLADVVVEVRGITIDLLNSTLVMKFISVNPNTIDAWDPETEEGAGVTIPAKLISPPPPVPQNLVVNEIPEGGGGGGPTVGGGGNPPFVTMDFDQPIRSDLLFRGRYRENGSPGGFFEDPFTTATFLGGGRLRILGGYAMVVGHTFEVQVQSRIPTGIESDWSASALVVITHPPGGGA